MFENLGIALRLLRELRGSSQAALARQAGLGKSQLSKYETGREIPKIDSLERLLTALKISLLDLALTLSFIDGRRNALSSDGTPEALLTSVSLLEPAVQTAFEQLQTDMLRLHREVLRMLLQRSWGKGPGEGPAEPPRARNATE
jgi:transcriptional regulator with XRE-family HTH domain